MYKIIRKVEDDESVVANHVLNKETAKQLLMNDVYNHIENRGCRRIESQKNFYS